MLEIKNIYVESAEKVRGFDYTQKSATTTALLCTSSVFLDELTSALKKTRQLSAGEIALDEAKHSINFVRKECMFITNEDVTFQNLNVAENIFIDCSCHNAMRLGRMDKHRDALKAIDPAISFGMRMDALSTEQRKIVEIVRAVYCRPRLLVVRDLVGLLSMSTFSSFADLLKKLNEEGTTVLYLTDQWEEAVRLKCDISVVVNGDIVDSFSAKEVQDDPSRVYFSSLYTESESRHNKKFEDELAVIQFMKRGIKEVSDERNTRRIISTFSNYLCRELRASSVVTYLIDTKQFKFIHIVPVSDAGEPVEIAFLNNKTIRAVLESEDIMSIDSRTAGFHNKFEKKPSFSQTLCYSMNVNSDISLVTQVNFRTGNDDEEFCATMVEWVVQEMALFIENLLLMGNSLLLKESHHRIKNNLQVIVSLLEMEKLIIAGRSENIPAIVSQKVFDGAISRIKCIASIHDMLSKNDVNTSVLDISSIINSVSEFYRSSADIKIAFDEILIPYSKAVSVAMVINEIINNSVKHNEAGKAKPQIDIVAKLVNDGQAVAIECRDNGVGFSGFEFNGSNMGVGMLVVESVIVEEMKGTINRYNHNGAVVDIMIPMQSLLVI